MSVTPDDHEVSDNLVAAACEIIRSEGDGCIISIDELLDKLSENFGDRFLMSSDTDKMLTLIRMLWDEPHIHNPEQGWIEFVWDDERSDGRVPATLGRMFA
jgi:hypothetical protein